MSKAAELANLIGNINAGGGDNFIINGGMTISQRGSSFTNPSSNAYCLDRYAIQWSGISPQFTVSQDTSTPDGEGFYKSLKIATSNTQTPSSGQGAYMYQKVEGSNISNIMFGTSNAKRLVLSFYVKSSKTGTYSVGFHNNGFDRNLVSEYTISSANTWEKKTIRFVGDTSGTWTTDTSIGMGVYFHLSNGDGSNTTSTLDSWQSGNNYLGSQNQVNLWDSSSATWFITGVSLEVGQNPTSFEHEPIERTLNKCYRYTQRLPHFDNTSGSGYAGLLPVGRNDSTTINSSGGMLPVSMRDDAAIESQSGNFRIHHANASTALSQAIAVDDNIATSGLIHFLATVSSGLTAGAGSQIQQNNDADAHVILESEL